MRRESNSGSRASPIFSAWGGKGTHIWMRLPRSSIDDVCGVQSAVGVVSLNLSDPPSCTLPAAEALRPPAVRRNEASCGGRGAQVSGPSMKSPPLQGTIHGISARSS